MDRLTTLVLLRRVRELEAGGTFRTFDGVWRVREVFNDGVTASFIEEEGKLSETVVWFGDDALVSAPET